MSDESRNEIDQEIRDAIFAGQKILAIKLYRELTGHGLKESKDFIEALTDELWQSTPAEFKAPPASGCGSAAAVLLLVPAIAWWMSAMT